MDSTPPPPEPRNRTRSSSRRSKIRRIDVAAEISPAVPNQELFLLSPSPNRRTKSRLPENLETVDHVAEPAGARRRRRTRNASSVLASPRNARRQRKRIDQEKMRGFNESGVGDGEEGVRRRKKRQIVSSKKDKLSLVPSIPSPKSDETQDGIDLDRIGKLMSDVLMWRDVARSSFWFGFGSLCFLSSCFASGINFCIFSVISEMGLFFLVVSFILNTLWPRELLGAKSEMKLKEDNILRMGRFILPAVNLTISKTRDLFSGEPAMTLKVVPFLMLGAEYGHLLTLWRLCALGKALIIQSPKHSLNKRIEIYVVFSGFFASFTAPRLYSSYNAKIHKIGACIRRRAMEAWGACSHKKIIAASALSGFWNLTSVKTRIFTAFICLALIRYHRTHSGEKVEAVVEREEPQEHKEEAQEHEEEQEHEEQENDHKKLIDCIKK
ncbi:hypothetical protein DM860_014716 [Cuscuta australis]|uniref:Reticulon domain-containing protein n=1 Tax=Cuscuta australis TaxID=267555 RepID=A0A328DIN0_9ASTE|nr:hypothetical protein DM860_014716 [Cuscuta australis]